MINITCGDNISYMKRYPDNFFSIGITDIPYGINVDKMSFINEKKKLVRQKNGTKLNPYKSEKYHVTEWDKHIPSEEWFEEFNRVTQEQIFFGVEYVKYSNIGKGRLKWNKGVPDNMSFKGYEMAYCSFIDYTHKIDYLWSGMMQGKSIKQPLVQKGDKKLNEKRIHPTQKPVILWDIILLFCQENKIDISSILDTNCGSCSLALSAYKFNSSFYGRDINPIYIEKARKRINRNIAQQKLFNI